jgi:outer membrane protein TolC
MGVVLAVGWCVAPAPARAGEAAEPGALDLQACYARALERNERIGLASAEWRAAEARYRQAHDTLLPAVTVGASAEFQNDRREGTGDAGSRSPEIYGVRLGAQQALYRGLRTTRVAEAREAEGRAARLEERRERELLYLDVADAFHVLLAQERDLLVLDRLVQALEESVKALEERVRLGRSRRAEWLNAQTDLAEARVEQEAVRGQQAAARELLAFLIDLPAEQIRVADASPFPELPDVQTKLAAAEQRADVQAGEARTEAARRNLQAAQGERQPEIMAGGNLFLYEDPDEEREWNVVLTMNLPLFDEGVIRARGREQAEQVRISELNLAALRRSAASDVRSAYTAFLSAAAQRARLEEARAVARENFEVQNRDYEIGRASQLDALTTLAQWQRLERRASAADVQARASLVRLHVAAGGVAP